MLKSSTRHSSRLRRTLLTTGVIVQALLLFSTAPAGAASIVNGGFETGNFTGWTVVDQAGGSGAWFVYSGTTSPLSASTIPAPPEGTYGAISDQTGPGSHVLYQDVTLEPGMTHALSFILYYNNQFGSFSTPPTLDYTVSPNQQYRVDVMKPTASPFSVAPGDVLAQVFATNVGDPASLAPTTITFDLSPFAGTTVRLRFAEVDNQFFFQAGVDDVKIQSADVVCPSGIVPTRIGTNGPDSILGTSGNDVIFSLGGNDKIDGGGGNDIICGGPGDDLIAGGTGNDQIFGGTGNDGISGDAGADKLYGGAGKDKLADGTGVDQLYGGGGDDSLSGFDGAPGDLLNGGPHMSGDVCGGDPGDILVACNP